MKIRRYISKLLILTMMLSLLPVDGIGFGEIVTPEASQAASEPSTESLSKSSVEPLAAPSSELSVEPPSGPPSGPPSDPSSESPAEPPSDPSSESPAEPPGDPSSEPPAEPPTDPSSEPPAEPPGDPSSEPPAEPPGDPSSESPSGPKPETPSGFYDSLAFYQADVGVIGAQQEATAVVALQSDAENRWETLADPSDPDKDFEILIYIDRNGSGSAEFPLKGLPKSRKYQARLVSYDGVRVENASGRYAVEHSDGGEDELLTTITIRVVPPQTSETADPPTDEPTGETPEESASDPTDDPSQDLAEEPTVEPPEEIMLDPLEELADDPTGDPSGDPSGDPPEEPASDPSDDPPQDPTEEPSDDPSDDPTGDPPEESASDPTGDPSGDPLQDPPEESASNPSGNPSDVPSGDPSQDPSEEPASDPSGDPSDAPSGDPSQDPSEQIITDPLEEPADDASEESTEALTEAPAEALTEEPQRAMLGAPLKGPGTRSVPNVLTIKQEPLGEDENSIPVSITIDTSDPQSEIPIYTVTPPANASCSITSRQIDKVTFTLTPKAPAPSGVTYEVVVNVDNSYTVTQIVTGTAYRSAGTDVKSGSFSGTPPSASAVFPLMKLIDVTGLINWNDNNSTSRPTADRSLTLEISTDDGATWDPTTVPTPTKVEVNYNTDSYSYTGLDAFVRDGQQVKQLFYRVVENSTKDIEDYFIERIDNTTIRNTLKTSLTVYKQWYDAAQPDGFRPSPADWQDGLTLRRNGEIVDLSEIGGSLSLDSTGDHWTLNIDGLPAFAPNGAQYIYTVTDSVPGSDTPTETPAYKNTIHNIAEHAGKTDTAYNGGTLISTVTAITQFKFNKVWMDGNRPEDERPDVDFYMYRFTEGGDYSNASPVQGMDKMTVDDGMEREIIYTVDGADIPVYDEMGRRYIYYLMERIPNNDRNYIMIASGPGQPEGNPYIHADGTATNISSEQITPKVTKSWDAKALQGMNASITVRMYRQSDASPWQPVPEPNTMTISGFTAEQMSKTAAFVPDEQTTATYPRYDENGYEYTYSFKEIKATINGEEASPAAPATTFEDDDRFTAGGYTFRVNYDADGNIINTLEGDTKLRIRKVWNPEVTTTQSFDIHVLRDDVVMDDFTGVIMPQPDVTVIGDRLRITGQGNVAVLLENLPKYNANGREYSYTVEEITQSWDINGTIYGHYSTTYSVEELTPGSAERVKTATILNVSGPGTALKFHVYKRWLDDNDTLHRVPVNAQLYYRQRDAQGVLTGDLVACGAPITLTADSSWYGLITHGLPADATDFEKDYGNYLVREVSNGAMTVDDYADAAATTTTAETDEHLYEVSINGIDNIYTIRNLRVGVLQIVVEKQWAIGDLTTGFEAAFIVDDDQPLTPQQTMTITQGQPSASTGDLPKYDAEGVLIQYTVREGSIKYGGEEYTPTDPGGDGTLIYNTDVGRIVSSHTTEPYVVGPQHTNDTMKYIFTNKRSESAELVVNKVWRDTGVNVTRPDIVLVLRRRSGTDDWTNAGADRIWDTVLNPWYWRCSFGVMPKYDASGYPYEYSVIENIVQESSSMYKQSYYNGTDQPVIAAGTTEDTFSSDANGTYAVADFIKYRDDGTAYTDADTIINTLQDRLIYHGQKLWLNVPGWFDKNDMPEVTIHLYRTIGTPDPAADELIAPVTISGKQSSFRIPEKVDDPDLPMHDKYGNQYNYYVREMPGQGVEHTVNGYNVNVDDGVVTNTYVDDDPVVNPYVAITVNKLWDWAGRDVASQTTYPKTTFTLYQEWGTAPDTHAREVAVDTLPGGDIDDYMSSASPPTLSFTEDSDGQRLLYYAPDGEPFRYSIEEAPVPGYTTTQGRVPLTLTTVDNATYTATQAFENVYDHEELTSVVAYKVWDDFDNGYGTRPDIAEQETAPNVVYSLLRRVGNGDGEDVTATVDAQWTQDATDANQWICTFIPKTTDDVLYKYNTDGHEYTYYVTEELKSPYNVHYTQSGGDRTRRLTNTLETVDVFVNKIWKDSNGNTFTLRQLDDLHKIGALGTVTGATLTFAVQQSDDGGGTWDPIPDLSAVNVSWDSVRSAMASNKFIRVAEDLPKYIPDRVEAYSYWAQETTIDGTPVAQSAFAVTNPYPTGTARNVSDVTNSVETRKLFFVKNWDDGVNRDGNRPASVDIEVTRTDVEPNQTATVRFTRSTPSDDPKQDTDRDTHAKPEPDDGTRYLGEMTVPLEGEYTAAEVVPDGYTEDTDRRAEDHAPFEGDPYDWWSFTNSYTPKTITIEATKLWAGTDENKYGDRPQKVTFQLQRQAKGATGWDDVGEPQELTATATGWTPARWTGLNAYQPKTESHTASVGYNYRVVETPTPSGYAYSSNPVSFDASSTTIAPDDTVPVVVTNTLVPISHTVTKTWADGGNTAHRDEIVINLQRRVKTTGNTNEWENVTDADTGDPVTATLTATTLTHTFNDLPRYKDGDPLQAYEYHAVENAVPDYYEKTPEATTGTATAITNTLRLATLVVRKEWKDQAGEPLSDAQLEILHALGAIPETLTFEVQRRPAGSTDENEWASLSPAVTKDSPWNGTFPLTVDDDLPLFVGGVRQEYRAVETNALPTGMTVDCEDATTPATPGATETTFTTLVTNNIETRKLFFVKNWDDRLNRDKQRPASIVIAVVRDGVETQTATVTLDAASTTTDPNEDTDGHEADASRYRGDLVVPKTGEYTATEVAPAAATGYTEDTAKRDEDHTPFEGNPYDWWSFTNSYTPKTISVSVQKQWSGDGNAEAWGDRPASVSFELQRRAAGTAEWVKVPVGDAGMKTIENPKARATAATGYTLMWEGLYLNAPLVNNAVTPYEYRVVENPEVAGYTNDAASATITYTAEGDINVNVTNTFVPISHTVTKTWDEGTPADTTHRPPSVVITLQRRVKDPTQPPEAAWADVEDVTTGVAVTATLDDATLTHTFRDLPQYKEGDPLQEYEYRAVEKDVPNYYEMTSDTEADTTAITNTLWLATVLADKEWRDGDGNLLTLNDEKLTLLHTMGAIPDMLTFHAQRRVPTATGGSIWQDLPGTEVTVAWDAAPPYFVADGLPRFINGVEQVYRAVETDVGSHMAPSYGDPIIAEGTNEVTYTTLVTNNIRTRKLYFVKNWIDRQDRARKRPASIGITVTRNGDATMQTTVTLDKNTTSTDPSTDPKHVALRDGTRYRGELLVPRNGSYTAVEVPPDASANYDLTSSEDSGYWWSFTNTYRFNPPDVPQTDDPIVWAFVMLAFGGCMMLTISLLKRRKRNRKR